MSRVQRVVAELDQLAGDSRARVAQATQRCAETARVADETTGKLAGRWNRRIQFMRQRPEAAKADWRNDQLTDG